MLALLTTTRIPALSLSDAKRSLGVTGNDNDTYIEDLVTAATNILRRWTGRELTTAQYRLSLGCFPWRIELPFPPLASVESVKYYDPDGVDQTLAEEAYQLVTSDTVPALLVPAPGTAWPSVQVDRVAAVRIEYTAGTATAPPEARQFIRMLTRHWYDNPSGVVTGTISKEVEFALRSLAASLGTGFYADV